MESNYNWDALTRYVLNESSAEERENIEAQIKLDTDLENAIKGLRKMVAVKQKPFDVGDVNQKWEVVKARLNDVQHEVKVENVSHSKKAESYKQRNRIRQNVFNVWRYAAVILFTVGMSYFLSQVLVSPETQTEVEYKTLAVNSGERKTIVLYDGTTVNLDSGSKLRYPKKFGTTTREVYLEGEAFFQVAKNPHKPFQIHTANALVEVLGTKFNVRSWDEDDKGVTVTVTEGKVALGLNQAGFDDPGKRSRVLLTKNMQSSLSSSGKISKPIMVDASNYSKWMNNEMDFKDASLKQIVLQLERWYGLKFDVDKRLLEEKNLTVHLSNTNLNDVLELISAVTNTKVERHGNNVRFVK